MDWHMAHVLDAALHGHVARTGAQKELLSTCRTKQTAVQSHATAVLVNVGHVHACLSTCQRRSSSRC